ncbi:rhomboid family intramembrane serine protease [Bacillus suaedaesalsae]|uniref:Rhomboid family intramembrane serine protease n=1 Tax=Bacillus suaedaesalsae TaxID=2810349 RepID=A0ABS2DGW0_9BACI|nr:rhomboid family intramembrane serine protease [Bacillus suaedaesalsae]MBM6617703.1 rhomboid family intramembrane serine protease [Bacillus suaedaesalsae]
MFLRTESFQQFIRFYPIVTLLVSIHFLLWLWINLALPGGLYLFENMVGYNMFVEYGEWWRLFTPILLHISFSHALFNSFSLVLFGPALEKLLGKVKFIIAYVGAGLIANVATFYLEPSDFQHLGASGAIYGLFGIYLYMVVFRKELIDAANAQLIVTILVIGVVMTFIGGNINIVGHIFGFIGGVLIAPLVLPKRRGTYTYSSNPNRPTFNFRNILPRRLDRNSIFWIILIVLIIIGIFSR